MLDDPVTAQYTHTLTVTTGGEYTCTLENNKPSSATATIMLIGMLCMLCNHCLIRHDEQQVKYFVCL